MKSERRIDMSNWESSEKAIQDAIWEIEKIGADEKLTEAVILLSKAKELVSDFIDTKASTQSDPQPPTPPTNPPGPKS